MLKTWWLSSQFRNRGVEVLHKKVGLFLSTLNSEYEEGYTGSGGN